VYQQLAGISVPAFEPKDQDQAKPEVMET
jgi:hypothetical protein